MSDKEKKNYEGKKVDVARFQQVWNLYASNMIQPKWSVTKAAQALGVSSPTFVKWRDIIINLWIADNTPADFVLDERLTFLDWDDYYFIHPELTPSKYYKPGKNPPKFKKTYNPEVARKQRERIKAMKNGTYDFSNKNKKK